MKKAVRILLLLLLIAACIIGWLFLGPATGFKAKEKYLYIPTNNATKENVLQLLKKDSLITRLSVFSIVADRVDYWKNIKPGKYKIASGDNIVSIARRLKNGRQEPVNLIITKLRLKEDLASIIGKRFECDSATFMQFLLNRDTLAAYDLDSNTVMTTVFPETYTYFWNTTPSRIFHKLYAQYKNFWTAERRQQARAHGLTPSTAYILASIVEEETIKNDEKPVIASVYLNRIAKGMKLGADPTVKYALRDFGLKRIYFKYITAAAASPYNTYTHTGLPPGPICTPSQETLKAVLNAATTDYLFFCARPDFSGYHAFASNEKEHFKNAKAYQEALNRRLLE